MPVAIFSNDRHPRLEVAGVMIRRWLTTLVIPSRAIYLAGSLAAQDAAFSNFYSLVAASHEWLVAAVDNRGDVLTYVLDNMRANWPETIRECQRRKRLFRYEDETAGESIHWHRRLSMGNFAGCNSSRLRRDGHGPCPGAPGRRRQGRRTD